MDALRWMKGPEADSRTFENVRGEDVWTLVCLGDAKAAKDGENGKCNDEGGGGFHILRNGAIFAAWSAAEGAAALRAYQGLTGRWAVPAATADGAQEVG